MKKYLILLLSLMAVAISCNKENQTNGQEEKYVAVKLNVGGEISTSNSPLTKSEDSDVLFGIWIGKDGAEERNHFGGGLFDKTGGIEVQLLANHTYTFRYTLVKNGKSVVKTYPNNNETGYSAPFNDTANPNSGSLLTNRIGYVGIDSDYKNGARMYNWGQAIKSPSDILADRYYGEIINYTPTENGTLTLDLKHTVVGVKYKIEGLSDGSVNLTIKRGNTTLINEPTISSDTESEGLIFECSDVYYAWQYPNIYKETASVGLKWSREIGITQDLGSVEVDLLRNRMNIINITLGANDGNASFGIYVEQTSMANEGVTIEVK